MKFLMFFFGLLVLSMSLLGNASAGSIRGGGGGGDSDQENPRELQTSGVQFKVVIQYEDEPMATNILVKDRNMGSTVLSASKNSYGTPYGRVVADAALTAGGQYQIILSDTSSSAVLPTGKEEGYVSVQASKNGTPIWNKMIIGGFKQMKHNVYFDIPLAVK